VPRSRSASCASHKASALLGGRGTCKRLPGLSGGRFIGGSGGVQWLRQRRGLRLRVAVASKGEGEGEDEGEGEGDKGRLGCNSAAADSKITHRDRSYRARYTRLPAVLRNRGL